MLTATLMIQLDDVRTRYITPENQSNHSCSLCRSPCDLVALRAIAQEHNIFLAEDAAHAAGTRYRDEYGSAKTVRRFSFPRD